MLTGLRARRWCQSPELLHMISLKAWLRLEPGTAVLTWLHPFPHYPLCTHSSQKILPVIFCTRFTEILFIQLTVLLPSPSFKQTHIFCLLDGGVSNLSLLKFYDLFFSSHFLRVYVFPLCSTVYYFFDNFHFISHIGIIF